MAEKKLASLLRARQAAEHEAVRSGAKVADVVASRQERLRQTRERYERLLKVWAEQEGGERLKALQQGDAQRVHAMSNYARRLQRELSQVQAQISEQERELESAVVRLRMAEEDIGLAAIERKKIEALIAEQEHRESTANALVDELLTEELSRVQGKGGGKE